MWVNTISLSATISAALQNVNRKVIYILCQGHSGSTLLDLLIGNHPAGVSVGELSFNGQELDVTAQCSCGAITLVECDFWSDVDGRIRQLGLSLSEAMLIGRSGPLQNDVFFDAVTAAAGARFLVESSKTVGRLRSLGMSAGIDVFVVILVRNPVAVIASNVRRGRPFYRTTMRHLVNAASKLDLASKFPHIQVRYEDLVTNTEGELRRIMGRAGYEVAPGQDDLRRSHAHIAGGNPIRFRGGHQIEPDERWRAELSPWQQAFVRCVVNPITIAVCRFVIRMKRDWTDRSRGQGCEDTAAQSPVR